MESDWVAPPQTPNRKYLGLGMSDFFNSSICPPAQVGSGQRETPFDNSGGGSLMTEVTWQMRCLPPSSEEDAHCGNRRD